MTAVTFQGMVNYVDRRVDQLTDAITRLTDELVEHKQWHSELMARELEAVKVGRVAWWSVGVALVAAVGSMVVAVLALSGHG